MANGNFTGFAVGECTYSSDHLVVVLWSISEVLLPLDGKPEWKIYENVELYQSLQNS